MPASWKTIEADPDYARLPDSEKLKVKQGFFSNVIAQDSDYQGLAKSEKQKVQSGFFGTTSSTIQRDPQTLKSIAGQTLKTIGGLAKKAISPIPGTQEYSERLNALYEKLPIGLRGITGYLQPSPLNIAGTVIPGVQALRGMAEARRLAQAARFASRAAEAIPLVKYTPPLIPGLRRGKTLATVENEQALARGMEQARRLGAQANLGARAREAAARAGAESQAEKAALEREIRTRISEAGGPVAQGLPLAAGVRISGKRAVPRGMEYGKPLYRGTQGQDVSKLQALAQRARSEYGSPPSFLEALKQVETKAEPVIKGLPGAAGVPNPLLPTSLPPPRSSGIPAITLENAIESGKKAVAIYEKPKMSPLAEWYKSGSGNLKSLGTHGIILDRKLSRAAESYRGVYAKDESALRAYVDKLTPVEQQNLINVRDIGAKPLNANVEKAANVIKALDEDVASQAEKIGVPGFQRLQNHYPHRFTSKQLTSPEYAEKFISEIMETDGIDRVKATQIFNDIRRNQLDPRSAYLQKHRKYNVEGWSRSPSEDLRAYYASARRKLEYSKVFGPNNEAADRLLEGIGNYSDRQYATEIFRKAVFPFSSFVGEIGKRGSDKIRGAASIALLGESGISNALQGVWGSLYQSGIINTGKAIKNLLSNSIKSTEDAIASGAASDRIIGKLTDEMFSAGKFSKQIYLAQTEKLNRTLSDTAARVYADDLLKRMSKLKTSRGIKLFGTDRTALEVEARRFGFRLPLVEKRGYFTDKELDRMALRFSDYGQGNYDALNLPSILSNPVGSVLAQFLSTPFILGKNISSHAISEAARGNVLPLGRLVVLGGALGEIPADVKAWIRGEKRPSFTTKTGSALRWVENLSQIMGFGIVENLVRPMTSGYGALAQPPAAGVVQNLENAVYGLSPFGRNFKEKKINVRPAEKAALKYGVPFAVSGLGLPPVAAFPTVIAARIAAGRIPKNARTKQTLKY